MSYPMGTPCGDDNNGYGYCGSDANECEGERTSGLCPGPAENQCCISHECVSPEGDGGYCVGTGVCGDNGGTAHPGLCPGNGDVQCCTGLDEEAEEMMSGGM